MKKFLLITAFFLTSVLAAQAAEMQDVVYLKNGSIVRGTIVEQVPGVSLKVEVGNGSVVFCEIKDVEKLTREEIEDDSAADTANTGGGRGFVDAGGIFLPVDCVGGGTVTVSYGYQSPYGLFLGGGAGFEFYPGGTLVPVFFDSRYCLLKNRNISPVFGCRLGYSFYVEDLSVAGYCYFNPFVGVRLGLSDRCAANLQLGYNMQVSGDDAAHGLVFKVGFEF